MGCRDVALPENHPHYVINCSSSFSGPVSFHSFLPHGTASVEELKSLIQTSLWAQLYLKSVRTRTS